jgi:hypothetical protein
MFLSWSAMFGELFPTRADYTVSHPCEGSIFVDRTAASIFFVVTIHLDAVITFARLNAQADYA